MAYLTRHLTHHLTRHLRSLHNHRIQPLSNLPNHPFLRQAAPLSAAFSTATRRNTYKKPDIAARARQVQSRRLWSYAAAFSGVAIFVILVLNNFQDQLVFYLTPSDALEKYSSDPSRKKHRLGGLVLEGSITQSTSSGEMEFVVTDLITDILVRYQGSVPTLFREGHSVVAEGFMEPLTDEIKTTGMSGKIKEVTAKARSGDCYFSAIEVLAKHDEKYMPQEVAVAIQKNRKKLKEDAEAAAAAEAEKTAVA